MFDWVRYRRDQRALSRVPVMAWLVFVAAMAAQLCLATLTPHTAPTAADLRPPPAVTTIMVASLGDPLPAAKVMNLLLQSHDNQPGLSIPFASLDYAMLIRWLERILELDPRGPYPLLAASRLYGEVPDPQRQRLMLEFVHRQFRADPNRRATRHRRAPTSFRSRGGPKPARSRAQPRQEASRFPARRQSRVP